MTHFNLLQCSRKGPADYAPNFTYYAKKALLKSMFLINAQDLPTMLKLCFYSSAPMLCYYLHCMD